VSVEPHAAAAPEASAVNTRNVLWAACGAVVLLFGAIAVLNVIYRDAVPIRTMPAPQTFPEPRLNVDEHAQLQQLLAVQRRRLNEYRWADAEHQFVQIPIERAMHMIAQQGDYGPLLASNPALSSALAGAERAITPAAKSTATGPAAVDPSGGPTADQPSGSEPDTNAHPAADAADPKPSANPDPAKAPEEKQR
jgi:hypothetical protein